MGGKFSGRFVLMIKDVKPGFAPELAYIKGRFLLAGKESRLPPPFSLTHYFL
jgi:hypothetical protein